MEEELKDSAIEDELGLILGEVIPVEYVRTHREQIKSKKELVELISRLFIEAQRSGMSNIFFGEDLYISFDFDEWCEPDTVSCYISLSNTYLRNERTLQDIINIMFTDGLFDNLPDEIIEDESKDSVGVE